MSTHVTMRRATALDASAIANVYVSVFGDTPFTNALHPNRSKYPADYVRLQYQKVLEGLLDVAGENWVACAKTFESGKEKEVIVGFIQSKRLGDVRGKGLKTQMVRRGKATGLPFSLGIYLLIFLAWIYSVVIFIQRKVQPDRTIDLSVLKAISGDGGAMTERYKRDFPERWHVAILAVVKDLQGKGIGTKLMRTVMDLARLEGMPVALSSSPEGEVLYRKLDFELLSRFKEDVAGDAEDAGGYFVWRPT